MEIEVLNWQRLVYYFYFWGNIRKDVQAKWMFWIFIRDYNDDDLGNWFYYFQYEVKYLILVKVEGLFMDEIVLGINVQIVGIEGIDFKGKLGLIGFVQKGCVICFYFFSELLLFNEDDFIQILLSDYCYWVDFLLV